MTIISQAPKHIASEMRAAAAEVFGNARGRVTRAMNRIALSERPDTMRYSFSKASAEDLKRLTSNTMEDSYKRVTWTNPKDKKVYHILEEGRQHGKVQVRILDRDGAFVKNAELTPKNIVVFDNFYSLRGGISHGEIMETFLKRFNPFANVERLAHKKNILELLKYRGQLPQELEEKRFKELADKMDKGKKVDYISISEVSLVDASDVAGKPGQIQKEYVSHSPYLPTVRPLYERILAKGTRILAAAGNEPKFAKEVVNDRLAIDGVEGVGALSSGRISVDSSSRNSIFTQHYERRNYFPRVTKDENGKVLGVNLTGLPGTDMPLNCKTRRLPDALGGTSYAVPIRVAKLSLNDMMEGIL